VVEERGKVITEETYIDDGILQNRPPYIHFPMKLYSVILYQNGFSSDLITEKIIRDNIILTKQKEVDLFKANYI